MSLNQNEREELELLRAEKADRQNPNVCLIEGKLTSYEGEYSATGVRTSIGHVYLVEALEGLLEWRGAIQSFAWHIASEPLSFHALEEAMIKQAMGVVELEFRHSYSDLTGYLWTNEKLEIGGHDVLEEILQTWRAIGPTAYIALRVEKRT